MKTIPLPVMLSAIAGAIALPLQAEAAGLLLFTAAIGAIICVDYSHRYRGLRLPRVQTAVARPASIRFARPTEPHRLAA